MENSNMLYMAYDGDNAGRQVGRAILADDPDALHEVSARINLGHEIVSRWVQSHGGQFISGGGDEGTFSIPADAMADIETLRGDYQFATNLTMTIGAGASLSQAGKSLLIGKFRGKNTVVQYDPSLEEEIRQVSERVGQGTASPEEQKLGEAYLKPEGMDKDMQHNHDNGEDNCPYCQELKAPGEQTGMDDCPYCKDAEAGTDDCPYCKEMDGAAATDDCPYCQDMDHEEDCPYCKDMDAGAAAPAEGEVEPTAGPSVTEPTAESGEDYAAKDLNRPEIDKPQPGDTPAPGLGSGTGLGELDNQQNTPSNQSLDVKNGQPVESAPATAEEIGETPAAILAQLDADGAQATPNDVDVVAGADDSDVAPYGDNVEGNVSRPEDFDRDVPGDMGLAEDETGEPDLSGVLQEGLDTHAQNAQREKVVQMVSEALEGFKGSKQVLEKAKDQAPQLYNASLNMLRAMIEMAKMLGLNETTEETAEEVVGEGQPGEAAPGAEAGQDEHDWEEPFAEHPEHGGAAAQEDAAPGGPKPPRQ